MTQTEFAKRIGATQQTVSAWVNGINVPSIKNLKLIEQVTGIKWHIVVGMTGQELAELISRTN